MRYCSPNPHLLEGTVPTDTYYADLSYPDNDSWNSQNDDYYGVYGEDTPDFLADISVGRIPTRDSTRITYTLNKIVRFEQDTGLWKNNALHGGAILFFAQEDHEDIDTIDGATHLDAIEQDIMAEWTINKFYEHEGLAPSLYDGEALNEAAFTGDWRTQRYGTVNWAAHGAPTSIGRLIWDHDDGDGIPNGKDYCQYTFGLREFNGCPEKEMPVDTDTDGDGVPDQLDDCPLVFGTEKNNGCLNTASQAKVGMVHSQKMSLQDEVITLQQESYSKLEMLQKDTKVSKNTLEKILSQTPGQHQTLDKATELMKSTEIILKNMKERFQKGDGEIGVENYEHAQYLFEIRNHESKRIGDNLVQISQLIEEFKSQTKEKTEPIESIKPQTCFLFWCW